MTTASTTSYTAAIANGTAPIPFTFQALSTGEVAVQRAGIPQVLGVDYSIALNGDDTGAVTPLTSWATDYIFIYSNPSLQQPFNFARFGAFYPDQFNEPFDRLARTIIALNDRLNRAILLPLGEISATLPAAATRANGVLSFDVLGVPGVGAGGAGGGALADGSVTFAKMANLPAISIVGNNTGVSAVPLALTGAQVAALLPIAIGDTGSGGTKGLVPAPSTGDAAAGKFLKADMTWGTPPSGGGGGGGGIGTTSSALTFAATGGAAPGATFDGSVARVIDFHSIGAAPLTSPVFTGAPAAPTPTLGDNSTKLATTAFVTAAVNALINAAPGSLDTIKELADAIADDANFATTMTTALAGKAAARPTIAAVSASFAAADADNNTHKVLSGTAQTMVLGTILAGTSFTGRATTAWSVTCAGGVSKNGAAAGPTTAAIAANSLFTALHEGAGVWSLSGSGVS